MNKAIAQTLILNRVTLALTESVGVAQRQAQKRRVSTALEQVAIYPAMPPQAILVVRQLADPQPEQLLAVNRWQGLRNWEQGAQQALNECWRSAVRVARSPVPAHANSVWFADQAEWLACLSWDLSRGTAADYWWWTTALRPYRHHSPGARLFSLWQAEIRWLPAALMLLVRHHPIQWGGILSGFTGPQLTQLFNQVAQAYHCSPAAAIFADSEQIHPWVIDQLQQRLPMALQAVVAPLPLRQKPLVAACLNLAIARDIRPVLQGLPEPGFASPSLPESGQISPPLTDPPIEIAAPGTPLQDESTDLPPAAIAAIEEEEKIPPPDSTPSTPDVDVPNRGKDTRFKIVDLKITPLESTADLRAESREPVVPATPTEADTSAPEETNPTSVAGDTPPSADESREIDAPPAAIPLLPAITEETLAATQGVQTAVGGLWYLVNLLVALDWPGRSPLITPWHQLHQLAQAMLWEPTPDPVWGILTDLAGEPLPDAVASQWQRETIPLVTDYLTQTVDFSQPLADYLLEPATLYVTRTHIDVVFRLEQIQFELRVAGLDQDPGWVPALAHVIAFHYE